MSLSSESEGNRASDKIASPRTNLAKQPEINGIGEQLLSKLIEIGVSNQLDSAEIVSIECDGTPVQMISGEIDSLSIAGEGWVTSQDLRLEELDLHTKGLSIDLLKATLGELELTQPARASMRLALTAADLQRLLNSDYLREELRQLELSANERTLTVELQHVECRLPGNRRIALEANFLARMDGKTQPAALNGVLRSSADGQSIALEKAQYREGKSLPIEVTATLLSKMSEFLNLHHFQRDNLFIQPQQLEIEEDRVTLWVKVRLEQMP
jgi:hypothetical protein